MRQLSIFYKQIFLFLLLLLLTSCTAQSLQTKVFSGTINDVKVKMTYTYIGDRIMTQETTNQIPYTYLKVQTKEEAQALFDPFIAKHAAINGVTYAVTYKEDTLTERWVIDYEEVSFEELTNVTGGSFSEDPKKGVSMRASEKLILKSGYYTEEK